MRLAPIADEERTMDGSGPLLEVAGLRVTHAASQRVAPVPILSDASFEVTVGEIVCIVGESGSGKSVTAKAIMGLIQAGRGIEVSGSVRFAGQQLVGATSEEMRALRGRELAMVFQEPMSSLDPVFTIAFQLEEAVKRAGKAEWATRALLSSLLLQVGITDTERVLRSYPHQLSGGMCQRVMIAMALAARPRLLIADEPTTALDVTIQAQVLTLIDRLRHETGMSVLLVTHDMGVAAEIADRVIVMYAGRVVEIGDPRHVLSRPHHPYTEGLLDCIPPISGERPATLPAIPGTVPDPRTRPSGCAFHPRCEFATDLCRTDSPPLVAVGDGVTACWHPRNEEGE